ncbi:complex I NDUFA9 subunit family protein [Maritimibacter sp. 55A14]|uniref:complex I NDUFA9 subunit family protein n=1 Tax=Maritimibacter sp. 55A14 TaxID=2174844 RepID=UPI000D60A626|nr:complex I NDUFA9 subunit family protein [Maritimibacter sp. 55A14]PWE33594.1 complex I NDUFA9 subunit family protein [Maritimibacter sp. 55A14]
MSKLVTIFGGSGFVGRYITQRLAHEGWRVRVAVRRPNEAIFVRTYGDVGQVAPVFANIRDDHTTAEVIRGADVVINCVGILSETSHQKFDTIQAEGAARIARLAAEAGVERMVHISAIGADAESNSAYARTKAEGEAAVLKHFPQAVILRPSVIFGPEDQFFNRFAQMSRFSVMLPLVGAETRFQPVYVDDVAHAAAKAALGRAAPGIYELGGPDVASFRALMQKMLGIVGRRRLLVGLPFWAAWIMARMLGAVQSVTLGLFHNSVLTVDQVRQLRRDNVVAEGARGFADMGIEPTAMDAVLESYLYKYRPAGQYTALQASARNFRV